MKKGFPSSQRSGMKLGSRSLSLWERVNLPQFQFIHTFCEQGNARDSTRLVYAVKIMIYDVTVPITNTMPIWPGDPPVELVPISHESRNKTHIVNLTAIAMGSHTGTHIDAPFHPSCRSRRIRLDIG